MNRQIDIDTDWELFSKEVARIQAHAALARNNNFLKISAYETRKLFLVIDVFWYFWRDMKRKYLVLFYLKRHEPADSWYADSTWIDLQRQRQDITTSPFIKFSFWLPLTTRTGTTGTSITANLACFRSAALTRMDRSLTSCLHCVSLSGFVSWNQQFKYINYAHYPARAGSVGVGGGVRAGGCSESSCDVSRALERPLSSSWGPAPGLLWAIASVGWL